MPAQLPTAVLGGTHTWIDTFTPWVRFDDRTTLKDPWDLGALGYPGVYVLAHFPGGPPEGPADFLADEIFYVGQSNHLRRRLGDFDRSIRGKGGHSGGNRYFKKKKRYLAHRDHLYVAALPVWFGDSKKKSERPITSFFVDWAEGYVLCRLAAKRRGRDDAGLLNKY